MWPLTDPERCSRPGSGRVLLFHASALASIVVALASSCTSVPSWTIHTATIGDRSIELVALPCLERTAEWMSVLAPDEVTPAAWEGMEGSPVRDEHGVVRGYVADAWTGLGRGLVRIRPMSDSAWPPSTPSERMRTNLIESPTAPSVEPGESVGLLVWSGESSVVEAWGTVSAVDGRVVHCAFPDRSWGAASHAPGECLYQLVRAPIVAFGEGNRGAVKICRVGESIGAAVAENADCLVALLGVHPKCVTLQVSYAFEGRTLVDTQIEVVRDPVRITDRLVAAMSEQLERMILPLRAHGEALLSLDDDVRTSIDISGLRGSVWRQEVENFVARALREQKDTPGQVGVRVRMLSP